MIITLNIEAGDIRVIAVRGKKVQKWGSLPLPPGIVRDGRVLDSKALSESIATLMRQVGIAKGKMVVSVTGLNSVFRSITLPPKLKAGLREEAIRRAARKEMPVSLDELYLVSRSLGHGASGQEFFVIGIPREIVDAELRALDEAWARPAAMYLKPIALARAVGRREALIVDMESDIFSVTLVAEGTPAIVRTLAPRGGEATLEDNVRRLLDEISRTVQFYNRSHPNAPFPPDVPAFLTGGISVNPEVAGLLGSQLSYQVEMPAPPLVYDPGFPVSTYAVNIGLALQAQGHSWRESRNTAGLRDVGLDIISATCKPRQVPIGRLMPLFAAFVFLIGLIPAYQLTNSVKDDSSSLRSEWNMAQRALRRAQAAAAEEQKINDVLGRANTLEKSLAAVFPADGDTAGLVRQVLDGLPLSAQPVAIIIDHDRVEVNGITDDPLAIIDYALVLEQREDFAEVSIASLSEHDFKIWLRRMTSESP